MNQPQFKINGLERRKKKKELSKLRSYIKDFWFYHNLDKDMASFYGGTDGFPMSDKEAKEIYEKAKQDIQELEKSLNEPYI